MTTPDHRFRGIHAERGQFWSRCTCGWVSPPCDNTSDTYGPIALHFVNPEED